MSLSLSSLLNPSPDSENRPLSPTSRQVQSPVEPQEGSPTSVRRSSYQHAYPPTIRDEAAQALASLSTSPIHPPQKWAVGIAQDETQLAGQHSWERRPSEYGDSMQLPPPPPGSSARKMSSPTLDQYHVASRSPEQQRASVVSPTQPNITLAPMLSGYATQSAEQITSRSRDPNSEDGREHLPISHAKYSPSQDSSNVGALYDSASIRADGQAARPTLKIQPSNMSALSDDASPAQIKQETIPTPQPSSPADYPSPHDNDQHTSKVVSSLKNEHGLRVQSPLRESSVPVPTTETLVSEQHPTPWKKQTVAKRKKGTASAVKKEKPPAKKRKVEPKRSETPSLRMSKSLAVKAASAIGTPANSSPAPSVQSDSAEPNGEPYDEEEDDIEDDTDNDLYCICRKPDNGTFMIGCDGACDDWFHGKCVGIEERDKNLIDKYICDSCTERGIGRTTFKRMCRRSGCRQAARVGRTKGGSHGSKYCSDECGVTYFREMVARTRGREESSRARSSRRKSSISSAEKLIVEEELGARGGALSAGEVKALLDASKTAEEFRKLGDGVLSPPSTPHGKDEDTRDDRYTAAELQTLKRIPEEKDEARHRHALLKDRMKFVTLIKQAASRVTQERELKPKEYCGYDPRLEWTESQFQAWRSSPVGQQAFELETLPGEKSTDTNEELTGGTDRADICDRKKCARHHEWSKLAVDEIRFEMADNSDRMRKLATEEAEIKERGALRAKAGKTTEGTVEVHGMGNTSVERSDQMEVDVNSNANGIVHSVE